ncbi:MAG: hypothetical protein KKH77_01160 [Candidatus Omnitrophica bacterium]|nr:hypothetical protein [Candidatus Omnitrophota bacterium]
MKRKYSMIKIALFSIIPALLLLLSLELGSRVYFSIKYHKPHFLTYGFASSTTGRVTAASANVAAGENMMAAGKDRIVVYDTVKHRVVTTSGDVVYYKSVPGVYKQHYGFHNFKIRINSLGFRGNEFSKIKPKGIYRIFCMGGSTTEGLEVEDGKDYPSVLQRKLSSFNLPVKAEVINAGFMGSSSAALLSLLKYDILKYQPDMVTFCEAFNDYHSLDSLGPVAKIFRAVPRLLSLLYNKSLLFAIFLEKRCLYIRKIYNISDMRNSLSNYSESVRKIVALAKKNNIGIILAKQGAYIKGYDMSFDKDLVRSIAQKLEAGAPVAREDAYYYLHSRTRDILDEIGREMSVPVVDFHIALTNFTPDDVFYDTAHLTALGNEVIADALAKEIKDYIINDEVLL